MNHLRHEKDKKQKGTCLKISETFLDWKSKMEQSNLEQLEIWQEKELLHYKPVRVGNFWSNNYIEYGSKGDRNKTLWVKEDINEIKPYLQGIINNLKKFNTKKFKLAIAINIYSSKNTDEERVMHPRSANREFMSYDNADEVIN